MEKLKKGNMLYDLFLESLDEDDTAEIMLEFSNLNILKESFVKMNDKLTSEFHRDFVVKGIQTIENEMEYFGSLYYQVNKFVAWLNLVL